MDALRLISGPTLPGIALGREFGVRNHHPPCRVNASGPRAATGSGNAMETTSASSMSATQSYMFPLRLRRLWPSGGGGPVPEKEEGPIVDEKEDEVAAESDAEEVLVEEVAVERRRENWVLKILKVGSMWREREVEMDVTAEGDLGSAADAGYHCVGCACGEASEECVVGIGDDEEEAKMAFDQDSFSRLLRKVSVMEAQLYSKMSYIGSLAYIIPKIKTSNLLKSYGLRFVTSSIEKKGNSLDSKDEQLPAQEELKENSVLSDQAEVREKRRESVNRIRIFSAYTVAASAASYLQHQAKGIFPFGSSKTETGRNSNKEAGEEEGVRLPSPEETSFVATTSSVTAVIAGKEEMKRAVVKDLNSANSSPCEWYICDDDKSTTRYFVIQGSETLASWQANLLFEPIQFEELDVLVHRGIYEAAKGIYRQMLPEIRAHLTKHGDSATLRFTGHSLGGSLALLVNLMLLIRGEAPAASLLPVVTFGAPSVMCGGDYLLRKLELPKSHVQAITLHRDIVPRAFSCNYPDHVAKILKAVNGNFRNHPCLLNQKFLYAPMGKLLILQPEDKHSPPHHLLPPGTGLYILGHPLVDSDVSSKLLWEAQTTFLNSPHPLEILSDRSAYGSKGTIYRDHDMNSYQRSIHSVISQELELLKKAKREQQRNIWWPLLAKQNVDTVTVTAPDTRTTKSTENQFSFAGVLHGSRETFKRFRRLVMSQHVRMLVVILFPARMFLLGAFSMVNII